MVVIAAWVEGPKFAFWGAMAWWSRSASLRMRATVLAAAVFCADWLVSTVWWGVPWSLLAYSQLDVPGVAQLAVTGGAPLVSAMLAAISVALVAALTRDMAGARLLAALAAAWVALLAGGSPLSEMFRGSEVEVSEASLVAVQPDIPHGDRWGDSLQPLNLHRVRQFLARVVESKGEVPDALVLPENLLTAPLDRNPELASALLSWVDDIGVPVLTGLVYAPRSLGPGHYRSAVVWIEPEQGVTARFDKERAIPLLESARRFPGDRALRGLFGGAASWPRVEESTGDSGALRGPVTVTPVLCYEILFPGLVAQRRSLDSAAILNLADDSWAPSDAVSRHLTRIARYRAIEQRLPVIRVAHGGLSAAIDPLGRLEQVLPMHRYATMRATIHPMPPPTIGEKAAITGLPLMAFVVVWWAWGARARRKAGASRT